MFDKGYLTCSSPFLFSFFPALRKVIWEDKVSDITFKVRQRECLASTSLYLTVFISLEYVASRVISVHLEVDDVETNSDGNAAIQLLLIVKAWHIEVLSYA